MLLHHRILESFGRGISSAEFGKFLAEVESEPVILAPAPQVVFFEFFDRGISLAFDTELQAFDYAYLFTVAQNKFVPYAGELPCGVLVTDSAKDVEKKLGPSLKTRNESVVSFNHVVDADPYLIFFCFDKPKRELLYEVYLTLKSRTPLHE